MKILYFVPAPLTLRSGSTVHILETVKWLRKFGHQVSLAVYLIDEKFFDRKVVVNLGYRPGLALNNFSIPGFKIFVRFLQLLKLAVGLCANVDGFELVYVRDCVSAFILSLLHKNYIYESNNLPINDRLKPNNCTRNVISNTLYKLIIRRAVRGARNNVVVSEVIKDYYVNNFEVSKTRVHVIHNGANTEKFFPTDDKIKLSEIREEMGISDDYKVANFTGYIAPWRNLVHFVAIADTMLKELPEIKFLIVGDGQDRVAMEREVERRCLSDNFIFTGYVPQVRVNQLINISDVCFTFAKGESERVVTSPIKVYEYLACAKPVISTPGRCLEHIRDYIEIVPEREFADAFVDLLKDTDGYNKGGYDFILECQTWKQVIRRVERVILDSI